MAAASQTPVAAVPAKPAESGVHLIEWGCELVGTALLLIGGLSAVVFDFGPGSPLYSLSQSPKLLITGLLFAGTGSLVTISGLGRRSGAHLNPAVTLAFWTQRKVHPHDVVGYALAQVVGAVVGTLVLWGLWRHRASALHLGVTLPGRGLNGWEAMLVEVGMRPC